MTCTELRIIQIGIAHFIYSFESKKNLHIHKTPRIGIISELDRKDTLVSSISIYYE